MASLRSVWASILAPALRHFRYKSVAAARYRLDVGGFIRTLPKSPPQPSYNDREAPLLHKAVRPYLLHQSLFMNRSPAVLDQDKQKVKSFRRDRDNLTVPRQ